MAQEEKSKVVDIGEWKVKHGLALPDLKTEDETVTDVFISKGVCDPM